MFTGCSWRIPTLSNLGFGYTPVLTINKFSTEQYDDYFEVYNEVGGCTPPQVCVYNGLSGGCTPPQVCPTYRLYQQSGTSVSVPVVITPGSDKTGLVVYFRSNLNTNNFKNTFSGVLATVTYIAGPCPENSIGVSVIAGCTCVAGFSGSIVASSTVYSGACVRANCPAHSTLLFPPFVPPACMCDPGYPGVVTAITSTPVYSSSCAAVACPVNSNGLNVQAGCACDVGYAGAVTGFTYEPFFSSSCVAAACPPNSNGSTVVSGCFCNAGFSGTVVATRFAPFVSSCFVVACPAGSYGTSVSSGCSCDAGYAGSVTATTTLPFFPISCARET